MTKDDFKLVLMQYLDDMCDKWFDTNSIQDVLCKSLAGTIINANIDKYDNYLEYICDKNGQVCINDFIDNLIDNFVPYRLDLTKYNIPFLPNKILLIGKQDLVLLKNMCLGYGNNKSDNTARRYDPEQDD